VCVDIFASLLIETFKLFPDELGGLGKRVGALVFRETGADRSVRDFVGENVGFVQEQNHCGRFEPTIVAHGVEKLKRIL